MYFAILSAHAISSAHLYKLSHVANNTFGVKKVRPSKVESYLEVSAWTDLWQQDLISEYSLGLA